MHEYRPQAVNLQSNVTHNVTKVYDLSHSLMLFIYKDSASAHVTKQLATLNLKSCSVGILKS